MFGLLRRDGIECRFGGDHAVTSARLRVVAARWRDYTRSRQLNRDAEAQHWLGWSPDAGLGDAEKWLFPYDPVLLTSDQKIFVGVDLNTGRLLTYIELRRREDGRHEVGGMVDVDVRGQGFGREALDAVVRMAHQHFGIATLWAGCEATNVASQRWLASCGFVRTAGPAQHVLPNGRVMESLWWERVDATARRRCRRLEVPQRRGTS